MARSDSFGLFWEDPDRKTEKRELKLKDNDWVECISGYWIPSYKYNESGTWEDWKQSALPFLEAYALIVKTAGKRTPPEPVWLNDDYLPHYEEALSANLNILTFQKLQDAHLWFKHRNQKLSLIYDIECYPNYLLFAFKIPKFETYFYVEITDNSTTNLEVLEWIAFNVRLIGFNNHNYDDVILKLTLKYKSIAVAHQATQMLISENIYKREVLKFFKCKWPDFDSIDLIQLPNGSASLKIYGGRIGTKRMQDLPFAIKNLTSEQIVCMRYYCINDLRTTEDLYNSLSKEIFLREQLGRLYGLELKSKSDAQIAEAIMRSSFKRGYGNHSQFIEEGTIYKYDQPFFLCFQTPLLNNLLSLIKNVDFVVGPTGKIKLPEELSQKIKIGETQYKLGIGGLHSTEKAAAHFANDNISLEDVDVRSYYPLIILILGLFPEHLGPRFLSVFRKIVMSRLEAKDSGNKTVADSLKIVINGIFGKFGQAGSAIYSPKLLFQTTITGQLSLLMLIETMELNGIQVVSANTDGIVLKYNKEKESLKSEIIKWWENATGFEMEGTKYKLLASASVNSYVALKDCDKPSLKAKGGYVHPGLSNNPNGVVIVDAISKLLIDKTPIEDTIRSCTDIKRFLIVRKVTGGAVFNGEYLGKAVRWYYSTDVDKQTEIIYAKSGNKVSKSDGGKPMMDLLETIPPDLDYERYILETVNALKDAGLNPKGQPLGV